VSFAATNPIENGGSEYLGPSLVSKSPEARKRNYPRNTEWEPQCCTLSGSERKPPYYILLLCVSVLFFFDLSIPSFCESVLLFALSEKVDVSEIVPRSFVCPGNTIRATRSRRRGACQRAAGTSGSRKTWRQAQKPAPRNTWGPTSPVRRVANGERAERKIKKERKKEKRKNAQSTTKKNQPEILSFLLSFSLFLGGLVCVYRTRSAPIYHCTSVLCAMRTTSGHSGWWTTPSS